MSVLTPNDGNDKLRSISEDEIARLTKASMPLLIPWHPFKTVPLGTLFHSNRAHEPWAVNSPFVPNYLAQTQMVVQRDYGSQSVFRSQSTSRSTQVNDHLELGLGIGVGLPFLASVTVKGDYCKDVQENKDTNKTSVNFSTRTGYISLEQQPRLTTEAIIAIKYGGGISAFQEQFGDYYLAGYRLGGETGIMITGSSSYKKELERFGITVTVEVLFVEVSTSHHKDLVDIKSQSGLTIVGYDTLGHTQYSSTAQSPTSALKTQAKSYIDKAKSLDFRVADALDALDVHDGDSVDLATCERLVEAGLVVEMMLLPVTSLREVQNWMIEDDVI